MRRNIEQRLGSFSPDQSDLFDSNLCAFKRESYGIVLENNLEVSAIATMNLGVIEGIQLMSNAQNNLEVLISDQQLADRICKKLTNILDADQKTRQTTSPAQFFGRS